MNVVGKRTRTSRPKSSARPQSPRKRDSAPNAMSKRSEKHRNQRSPALWRVEAYSRPGLPSPTISRRSATPASLSTPEINLSQIRPLQNRPHQLQSQLSHSL